MAGKRALIDKILNSGLLGGEGIDSRDHASGEHFTALHYAVKEGRIKTAEFLLKLGINKNARTKISKETPLHLACKQALKKIMGILLSYSADPNLKDLKGQTPLHVLVKYVDSKEMVQSFLALAHAEVNLHLLDQNMRQAIDLASSREIKYLLKKARASKDHSLEVVDPGRQPLQSKGLPRSTSGSTGHTLNKSHHFRPQLGHQAKRLTRMVNLESSTSSRSNNSSLSQRFKPNSSTKKTSNRRKENESSQEGAKIQKLFPSKRDIVIHQSRKESV